MAGATCCSFSTRLDGAAGDLCKFYDVIRSGRRTLSMEGGWFTRKEQEACAF